MGKNTYALVLGSSSGFGMATCRELARLGYNIYGIHMDLGAAKAKAEEFRQELETYGIRAVFFNKNAADDKNRQEVIDFINEDAKSLEGHQVRVLIHSLAFGALKKFISEDKNEMISRKQIEMTMDVMANSLVYWTQDLFSNGYLRGSGRIMAFTSIGAYMAMHHYGAVSSAKAALESYIRQLAIEMAPFGITANSIHAGISPTPAASKIPGYNSMIHHAKIQNPFQRVTTAEDVAKMVGKLADEDFQWINGTVITVDGGESIYKYFELLDEN